MAPRLDYIAAAPDAYKAMLGFERYFRSGKSSLELPLFELIKLRASQINGCAYCVDMHWKDARAEGETEERLYMLSVWRESPLYSERERAALAWTELVTTLNQRHPTDAEYDAVKQHFDDKAMADLTWAIATINVWNRVAISFQPTPGEYKSPRKPAESETPLQH